MRVKTDHEEECEVMGVPEGLEALVAYLMVSGGVHQEHDEEHEMTGDPTSLFVVNVQGRFFADLCKSNQRNVIFCHYFPFFGY